MSKITFEIKKQLGTLSSGSKGWKKKLNLISWNGFEPKYDLRDWDSDHSNMGKGITLSKSELKELYLTLKDLFEGEKEEPQVNHKEFWFEINRLLQNAPMFLEEIKNIILFMEEQGYSAKLQRTILIGKSSEDVDDALMNEIESLSSIYSVFYTDLVSLLTELNDNELNLCLSFIIDPLTEPIPDGVMTEDEIFYCKGKDASATGRLTADGFVVLKGSICNLVESATAGWIEKIRSELKVKGVLFQSQNVLIFNENYTFSSPSAAAGTVLARRANGWTEWKNDNGITLDQLKRQGE